MNFSERLKILRVEKNLTQKDLAVIINKSRPTVAAYETNSRLPDADTLEKIARYFDVTIDYLLGKSDIKSIEEIFFEFKSKSLQEKFDKASDITKKSILDIIDVMYSTIVIDIESENLEILDHILSLYEKVFKIKSVLSSDVHRFNNMKNPHDNTEISIVYNHYKNELSSLLDKLYSLYAQKDFIKTNEIKEMYEHNERLRKAEEN